MPSIPLETTHIAPLHSPPSDSPLPLSARNGFNAVQPAQTSHRIQLIEAWGGKVFFVDGKVLELGCGQGDMTTVLVAAVSSDKSGETEVSGSVLGWDPAPGTYGSPINLETAQANLLSKPELKPYLSFSLDTPLSSLLSPTSTTPYTHAVLAHSIYYFPSPSVLSSTLTSLAQHEPPIKYLCLAEYALDSSVVEQNPHLLAVMAQSAFESLRDVESNNTSSSNVRTVMSPEMILEIAAQAGWQVDTDESGKKRETTITPSSDLQDGRWEVGTVIGERWMEEVESVLGEEREKEKAWIRAMRDGTRRAVEGVKADGKTVSTMDVWCAVLVKR